MAKTISDFPIGFQEDVDIYYNSQTAQEIGIELPTNILEQGIDVTQ